MLTQVLGSGSGSATANVTLMSRLGETVSISVQSLSLCGGCSSPVSQITGSITVNDPQLWWPWDMSDTPAYLYVLQVGIRGLCAMECVCVCVGRGGEVLLGASLSEPRSSEYNICVHVASLFVTTIA